MDNFAPAIADGNEKPFPDNEVNFLFPLFFFAAPALETREVQNEVDEILIQIHLRSDRGSRKFVRHQGIEVIVFGDRMYFFLRRRFKVYPQKTFACVLCYHQVSIKGTPPFAQARRTRQTLQYYTSASE